MTIFESGLSNKCKTFIVNRDFSTFSGKPTSSNIKISEQAFAENDPEWKVFKNKALHFRHLNINSILPKIEQLRPLLINSNISVLRKTETILDNTINNEEVEIDVYNLIQSRDYLLYKNHYHF